MKIAQISPLAESVPPKLYGGTERIVSYLTEELVRQGHEVTLFASADSQTAAELVPCCDMALRLNPSVRDQRPYELVMLDEIRRRVDEFDVLHFHTDLIHLPMVQAFAGRTVTTLHGRLDLPDLRTFYSAFGETPLVSISDAQRAPMPPVAWAGTVLHGLPRDLLAFSPEARGGYLVFLGRISPEKRPDRAIEIAAAAGMPLKMAAKVDKADKAYWEEVIAPLIARHRNVEFIGEIDERQKVEVLGQAAALLFPIDWPEPFGMVMIEAMACGTPTIAFRKGSVPEVVQHGVSGFIVDDFAGAVAAVGQIGTLDRARVREEFERRFTAARMTTDYLSIYYALEGVRTRAAHLRRVNGEEVSLTQVA